MKKLISFCILLIVAGCATPSSQPNEPPQARLSTPFNEIDYDACSASGTGVLRGQAFLKTRGGDVKYAAGNLVLLVPATTYTREALQYVEQPTIKVAIDPRLRKYSRSIKADGEGEFEFINLPSCSFIVDTVVSWEVPSQLAY